MATNEIRTKFERYRRWFRTMFRREFFNLPSEHQKRFMVLMKTFEDDCKKCLEEHKQIKEITVNVNILEVGSPVEGRCTVKGQTEHGDVFTAIYPETGKPLIGDVETFTIYSLDGKEWYSLKEEMILGRIK